MMESVREGGLLKMEAFAAWLGERGVKVDRTLVSHWASGRSHLPADLLPLLAEYTDNPERVFGPYVREIGCELMRLPIEDPSANDLLRLFLAAGAQLGMLHHSLAAAIAPEGPGGEAITTEERDELLKRADTLIEQMVNIRAHLRELDPE